MSKPKTKATKTKASKPTKSKPTKAAAAGAICEQHGIAHEGGEVCAPFAR